MYFMIIFVTVCSFLCLSRTTYAKKNMITTAHSSKYFIFMLLPFFPLQKKLKKMAFVPMFSSHDFFSIKQQLLLVFCSIETFNFTFKDKFIMDRTQRSE